MYRVSGADRKVGGRADAEAPDHWCSTQVSLIQDKLTNKAIDRVKGGRQSPGPTMKHGVGRAGG
jgi:hypothetical protein